MRSNVFKEARVSLYIFALIVFCCIIFYLIASMFTSMGYEGFHSSKTVDTVINNSKNTIIIDPGHGGRDPGASCNGLTEKDLNLEISILLADYLSVFGYDVVLTRNEDVLLYDENAPGTKKHQDLENRIKIAKEYANACFISVHMNKYPAEYCKGLQTFYSENNKDSVLFADSVQSNACLLQTYNKRKIKNGNDTIFVLENLDIPAILVECGFLSSNYESNLLSTDEYKRQLAFSLYCGVSEFLEDNNES